MAVTVLLWIVGVLAALGLLIAWTRVGVLVRRTGELLTVDIRVGPVQFRVFPGKEAPEKQEPESPKAAKPKKEAKQKSKSPITFGEIKDLLRTMWPPLKTALGRTRRSIRLTPLQLSLTLGGAEDPAETAQLYGELQGGVWTVMPVLEQLLDIRDPWVHLGVDFDTDRTAAEGTLGLSIRIGSALYILLGLAIPGLRWYLAFRKRHDTKPAPKAAAKGTN